MKKGLAALAAACFLFVGTGKAQAVVGIPDDVPGESLLFPFFKINPARTANNSLDTLVVITNTGNVDSTVTATPVPGGDALVHITIWNVRSEHVYDFNVTLTAHDVFSCSLYDIIVGPGCKSEGVKPAPPAVITLLQTTLRGETILAGYVTADVVSVDGIASIPHDPGYPFSHANILIGHEYVVDLPNGSAGGFNAVSIEDTAAASGQFAANLTGSVTGFYSNLDTLERFSGNSGDLAQTGTANATEMDLLVRYFTASALRARTEIWLWKECNSSDEINLEGRPDPATDPAVNEQGVIDDECADSSTINVAVYDEEENVHSITFNFPDEVNFVDVKPFVTPGVNGGWFRLPVDPEVQATAHSVQLAGIDFANLRWDAIFPAHRQYTDYIGGNAQE